MWLLDFLTTMAVLLWLISLQCLIAATSGGSIVAFSVGRKSNLQMSNGEVVTFDRVVTKINADFRADGKFYCKTEGLYAFHFYAVTTSNQHLWIELFKNTDYVASIYGRTPGDYVDAGNSVILELSPGDEVYLKSRDVAYSTELYGAVDQVYTTFTGVLISSIYSAGDAAFSSGLSNSTSLASGQSVIYDRNILNSQTFVNGTFTAEQKGIYVFHFHALATQNNELWLDLYLNDQYINSAYGKTPNEWADAGNTAIIYLHAGDMVTVRSRRAGGIYGDVSTQQIYTTFSGFLLSPDLILESTGKAEIAFSVGLTSHHTQAKGHVVLFDRVFINHGLAFDMKTGKFTAKYSGVYVFHYHALSESDKSIWIDLYHNFNYVNSIYGHVPSGYITGSNSATLELLQGDEVYLDIKSHNTALFGALNEVYCTFSGYFLGPMSEQPVQPGIIG